MRWRCTSPTISPDRWQATTSRRGRCRTWRSRSRPTRRSSRRSWTNSACASRTRTGSPAWLASRALKHKAPHDLVDLEILALGIAGKLLLWKALEQAQDSEPYLRVIDLNRLIDRATRQFDEVERERMRKAAQLFGEPVTVQYG